MLLDAEVDARTPSPAQREASRRQGRALLRAARIAWPEAAWLADLAPSARGRATAAGPGGAGAPGAALTGQSGAAEAQDRGATRIRQSGAVPTEGRGTARIEQNGTTWGGQNGTVRGGESGARRLEYRGGAHHAVVLGAAAAAGGCEPGEAARIAAYQAVAGPVSAAVRLLALDPMKATGVLARLASEVDQVAGLGATYAGEPLDALPCASAPALDLLAEAHMTTEVRLFES